MNAPCNHDLGATADLLRPARPRQRICWASLALLLSIAGSGCKPAEPGAQTKSDRPLVVFAAASTTDALEEILAAYTKDTGRPARTNFASSSTLAQQIIHGAEADLFLSANESWAHEVAQAGLAADRRDLLSTELVVIVPKDSTLELPQLDDLAGAAVQRLALGDPDSVPAGQYARQAFSKLGLWDRLRPKVVGAADVRQALAFVETGGADAGVVFATDAQASPQVRVVAKLDPALSDPIRYPLVQIKLARPHPHAAALYQYLASPAAAEIFRRHGFRVIESGATKSPAD